MVKTFNNIAEYTKKLLIENNEGIKEEDIILTANSDIDSIFSLVEQQGLSCSDTFGTNEFPLICYNVEGQRGKKDGKPAPPTLEKNAKTKSVYQGITAYHIDGFTFFKVRAINPQENPGDSDISMYAFTKDMYNTVSKFAYEKDVSRGSIVPKNGIYRAHLVRTMMGSYMVYDEVTSIQSNPAIHECKDSIIKASDFFFNNISLYSKFNQKPLRKFLLCGEPGTGKTSICFDIAKHFQQELPVIFVTDFDDMEAHIVECAKLNRKTVVVFEDCEASLRMSGANSKILNFLDGIDRPNIKDGAIIVMTTNHPERIEARITKRPGRIDKIFHINALEGKFAYDVFNLYFGDFMKENKFDVSSDTAHEAIEIIANGMTGAQIKELFNSYVCYMVSEGKEFNLTDVFNTKVELFNSFKDVDEQYSSLDTNSFNELSVKLSKVLKG